MLRALRGEDEFPKGYTGSRTVAELNELFDTAFRLQREASDAAGRYIPLVVENVKGAQPWVGSARWHFGSFYLWGDVPALMPITLRTVEHIKNNRGSWFAIGSPGQTNVGQNPDGRKVPNISFSGHGEPGYKPKGFNVTAAQRYREEQGTKQGGNWWHDPESMTRKHSSKSDSRKAASAQIAKIPFPLAQHIAKVFKP